MHLTLKFLGDALTEKLPPIKQALAAVARHAPACTFTVEGLLQVDREGLTGVDLPQPGLEIYRGLKGDERFCQIW